MSEVKVPSRTVWLPLSWNDPDAELAMRKYQELVRPNAPWCPSNIEFIRRINGLPDEQAVKHTIFNASYLVMGLGDVYLGAPVATPIDPRHRLVTTKYNPARTWTPENAVGIGGAYMCIYGMEGPGGYQLFGRTIQVWNTWRQTDVFAKDKPWLLDFFDQIRFFPVSHEELTEARAAFPHGGYPIRIEEGTFSYADYEAEMARNAESIGAFKQGQQAAFEAERKRWKDEGLDSFQVDDGAGASLGGDIPEGCFGVESAVPGNVWKLLVEEGQSVQAGDTLAIIESMKMEITVTAMPPAKSAICGRAGSKRQGRRCPGHLGGSVMLPTILDLASLKAAYASGLTPLDLVEEVIARRKASDDPAVFITQTSDEDLRAAAKALMERAPEPNSLPLWGVPFAVKDNIDVSGLPTTAACPAFAYQPEKDATVVARLKAAGAIVIGKTNLDQFATGLNGTRSPYGAPRSVFDKAYVSGGSSSGSAVTVAAGLASFALGTDTAGSGRVPAAFNNLVGIKPTPGLVPNVGVVPACRSVDVVTVFAATVATVSRSAR